MTSDAVSTRLHAVLDPLESILAQVQGALNLARHINLPASFTDTIKASITRLDDAHDELLEIATALNPTLYKHEH